MPVLKTYLSALTPNEPQAVDEAYAIMACVQPGSWSETTFLNALNAPNLAWQYTHDGNCVGFCIVQTLMTPQFKEWTLEEIAVHPEHQSQGYGHRLLQHMLEQAQGMAVDEIFLEVRESNHRAQSLYLQHGFEQIDRRKDYYPSLDNPEFSNPELRTKACGACSREDALIMRWEGSQ